LPLVRELREGGDHASPIVVAHPDHPVSAAFKAIAASIAERVERPVPGRIA
jgi:MinD-like ATPase involved in chromosome partitioning or flagellar assembly